MFKPTAASGMLTQQTGLPNQRTALPNQRTALLNQRTALLNQRTALLNQRTGLLNQRTGLPNQRTGLPNQQTGLAILQNARFDSNPLPGNAFIIQEKRSGLALVVHNRELSWSKYFRKDLYYPAPRLVWLCVETGNFRGFFNASTGMYLSYIETFDRNGRFVAVRDIDGGYLLQTPAGKRVAIDSRNGRLVTRQHAGACFKFFEV
ncbi:hypothetical protein ACSS6W_006717 [Trichoderma asperelloides]